MFNAVRHWWERRTLRRIADQVAATKDGYGCFVAPCTASTTHEERRTISTALRPWLETKLAQSATPYGLTYYLIGVGYVDRTTTRRPLERTTFSIENRLYARDIFDQVDQWLLARTPPTDATHLEVYFFSAGNVMRAIAGADER